VEPEIDLLAYERGSVVAPAGCGKTQLIVDALLRSKFDKPILVLTHTNAGVNALRARLQLHGVPSTAYRLSTIDGWAMRLISMFPLRSKTDPKILQLLNPKTDYPSIREAACKLLASGHLSEPLKATYSRLLVDEYQDCSLPQHAIVSNASTVLPTCVLGDPMQAIFGIGGVQLVNWRNDVRIQFPHIGILEIPWRWRKAGTENLGQWLLSVRRALKAGLELDLSATPDEVSWIELKPATAVQQRLSAAQTKSNRGDGGVLVIGDSMNPQGQRDIACRTPGALTVEAVDLKDLVVFGKIFDPATADALERLLSFAGDLMANAKVSELLKRVESLRKGTARRQASDAEIAAISFCQAPSHANAVTLLRQLSEAPGVRTYRPAVLSLCIRALRQAAEGGITFAEATLQAREQYRHMGRNLPKRAVGSTLLLKGLEADVVVILYPEKMDANHLYVALTRGARQIVICSEKRILQPKPK
jgi:AAA domain